MQRFQRAVRTNAHIAPRDIVAVWAERSGLDDCGCGRLAHPAFDVAEHAMTQRATQHRAIDDNPRRKFHREMHLDGAVVQVDVPTMLILDWVIIGAAVADLKFFES